jgi:hypothetical protein
MNINAGTNQYNLSLKKMKEEKRPTFATIFDKLDARSKKLNPKNPLNAVMTNDQMYRYYLEETEPMLREIPDDYDLLNDVIGGKSLKDMKLSEFAKLLSGELESDRNVKYETLTATITPTPAAPIIPSSITITTPPSAPAPVAPAPVAPPSGSAPAPVAPPSGSAPPPSAPPSSAPAPVAPPSGSAPAPVAPPSGSAPAPVAPPSAPSGSAPAPVAPPSSAPAAAPPAGSGLSIAIPPAGSGSSGTGSTPTGSTAGGVISGIASAASGLLSSAKSLLSSPKPPTGGPSGTSVPSSAVASAATTAPATGVPTATPVTGAATPAGGDGAAGGAVVDTGGYTDRDRISAFSRAIAAGLPAPRIPVSTTKTISQDENMIKYAIELSKYNTGLTDKKYSIKPTTAIGKIITTYERLNKRGASEEDIIIEIKKGK